jgi:tRNA pseudouridine55 synthase
MVLLAYKQLGETMGQCMDRIRTESAIPPETPMTYAGRLDPMAEGLVLFLVGDIRHKKDLFLKTQKNYRVVCMFGITTDSYDVLGIVPPNMKYEANNVTADQVDSHITVQDPFNQSFPPYSSRRVDGKALFTYAQQGLPIPDVSRSVIIHQASKCTVSVVARDALFHRLLQIIKTIPGNFRQLEISNQWEKILPTFPEKISVHTIDLCVSSGFYIRSWVHTLGEKIGVPAVTISLLRDKIGVFTLSMLNGASYRTFSDTDPLIINLLSEHI